MGGDAFTEAQPKTSPPELVTARGAIRPSMFGRTKKLSGEQGDTIYLTGRPVEALTAWMFAARIDKGSVFRGIGRWGTVSKRAIDPQSVNPILNQRAEMAGLQPGEFSAHGLRSGYLTEAANRGIPLPEAMEQSRQVLCSRLRVTTTVRHAAVDERQECSNLLFRHACFANGTRLVVATLEFALRTNPLHFSDAESA